MSSFKYFTPYSFVQVLELPKFKNIIIKEENLFHFGINGKDIRKKSLPFPLRSWNYLRMAFVQLKEGKAKEIYRRKIK